MPKTTVEKISLVELEKELKKANINSKHAIDFLIQYLKKISRHLEQNTYSYSDVVAFEINVRDLNQSRYQNMKDKPELVHELAIVMRKENKFISKTKKEFREWTQNPLPKS